MAGKRKTHFHISELKPRHWPRKSKAAEYRADILSLTADIREFDRRVQYAAQRAEFDIKSITSASHFTTPRAQVFSHVRDFTYEFENFCHRLYSYRDKMVQFINAALPVGFPEKEAKIKFVSMNPETKRAKLDAVLKLFEDPRGVLCKVIAERNSFTHNIYYGKDFNRFLQPMLGETATEKQFKMWCKKWREEIRSRAERVSEATMELGNVDKRVATRLIQIKDPKMFEVVRRKRKVPAKTKAASSG